MGQKMEIGNPATAIESKAGNHHHQHLGSGSAVLPGVSRISNGGAWLRFFICGTSLVRTPVGLSSSTARLPLF